MAKPLAQRGAAVAASVVRAPTLQPSAAVQALPSAPPVGPSTHSEGGPSQEAERVEVEVYAPPRASISRQMVPGAPPPQQPSSTARATSPRTFSQGGSTSGLTPSEIQRHLQAQADWQASQQRGGGGASVGLYTQHYTQHASRPPLPTGAVLVGAPATPQPAAQRTAQQHRQPQQQQAADAHPGHRGAGEALSARMDAMFEAIDTRPRGASAEAEDWAAVQLAERSTRSRGRGASTSQASGAANGRPPLAPSDGSLRAANAAAEVARQRLAALRAQHPDSFPATSRALYTPWKDDSAGGAAAGETRAEADAEDEVEEHCVAAVLGQRWRVMLAALLFVATLGVYLRGERAGWGVEGTPEGLLAWKAGASAALEPPPAPPPAPPLPPGVLPAPPAAHHGLNLVVDAGSGSHEAEAAVAAVAQSLPAVQGAVQEAQAAAQPGRRRRGLRRALLREAE